MCGNQFALALVDPPDFCIAPITQTRGNGPEGGGSAAPSDGAGRAGARHTLPRGRGSARVARGRYGRHAVQRAGRPRRNHRGTGRRRVQGDGIGDRRVGQRRHPGRHNHGGGDKRGARPAGIGARSAMPGQWLAIPLAATDPDAPQNAPTYARNHTSGAITATSARAASFGRTPTCPDPGPPRDQVYGIRRRGRHRLRGRGSHSRT